MYDFFQSFPGAIVLVLIVLAPISIRFASKEFKAWDRGHIQRPDSIGSTDVMAAVQTGNAVHKPHEIPVKDRTKAAAAIRWLTYGATLVALWQAVRFCQGHVGAPLIDQLSVMAFGQPSALKTPSDFAAMGSFFAWCNNVLYYLGGVGIWLFAGVIIKASGWTFERIVEVGFDAYRAEVEEERRKEKISAYRHRRAEAVRRDAKQSKSSFPLAALAIGIVIGKLF